MLISIDIKYFQGIESASLDFSTGLNVIKGPSHKGKSSIVRALKWLLLNEPRGFGFFSHFRPDKEITSVSGLFSEGIRITRKRSGTDSGSYEIHRPGEKVKILKALNTGVPDEVMQITKMNEINLRSQDDGRFLLDDNPGARAKYLNKLVGLEVIDKTLKKVNSEVTAQNSRMAVIDEDIADLETGLQKYKNIEKTKKLIKTIDGMCAEVSKLSIDQQTIQDLCTSIEEAQETVHNMSEWLVVERELEAISDMIKKYNEVSQNYTTINSIITSVERERAKIAKVTNILEAEKDVAEIDVLLNEHKSVSSELKLISGIIDNIEKEKEKIAKLSYSIKVSVDLLDQEDVCPTCGQHVEEWDV